MKGISLVAPLMLAAAGCAVAPSAVPQAGYYDLGAAPPAADEGALGVLREIDVLAPSWLESTALQYRLAYEGGAERRRYAESRWVASPAELIGHRLRTRLLAGDVLGACRLRVDLDEFVQVFDAPDSARGVLEARVQLLARDGAPLARRVFGTSRAAPSPDARGGVTALAGAVQDFAAALDAWLRGLDRGEKAGLNGIDRCRTP